MEGGVSVTKRVQVFVTEYRINTLKQQRKGEFCHEFF
jgi:hypothetical protein